jgi:hypothetical protein
MTNRNRLAGIALAAGGALSIAGYILSGTGVREDGDARFADPHFVPLYGIALAGAVLSVLGFPAVLTAHGERVGRLMLVGYAGTFVALAMLNLGEGVIEGLVKPYLVHHGGIPDNAPTSLGIYFLIATIAIVVGLISLGVAVIRAKVFGWWVGALLIASVPLSFFGETFPPPLAELADYCAFVALIAIGWRVWRTAEARDRRLVLNAEAAA